MRIKTLTAAFIWGIIWFVIVVAIGESTSDPRIQDGLPGMYFGGVAIYSLILVFNTLRRR